MVADDFHASRGSVLPASHLSRFFARSATEHYGRWPPTWIPWQRSGAAIARSATLALHLDLSSKRGPYVMVISKFSGPSAL